jgi:4-amino-4-deoxy-L-arabinose transferase-like glycosyltransferase
MAGRSETGKQYLVWQIFRKPNHDWDFYLANVPAAIGPLVLIAALAGLWLLRRERSWREVLLLAWIVVPVAFFQLWPTKGFQYLLPAAPAVAVLAARVVRPFRLPFLESWSAVRSSQVVLGLIAASLLFVTWGRIQPSGSAAFLAGTGGVRGGREVGNWIDQNIPEHAKFLAIGPSMANIVQFYGHRKAYGLSVSPNPLRRNPSYEAVSNPDLAIRNNEVHYVVWDSYSASRTTFFSEALMHYVEKYNGRVVHTEVVPVRTADGLTVDKPTIVVYEVRP